MHNPRHCVTERKDMVKSYRRILLLHSHDATALSYAVFEIERQAFLMGTYLQWVCVPVIYAKNVI